MAILAKPMQPEVRHTLGQISEAVEVTAVTRAEDSPLVDMNDFQDSESFGPRNRIREIRTFGSVGDWFKRLAGLPDVCQVKPEIGGLRLQSRN
jgi:hypothetical protein